ncbi:hypothetical protein GCM10022252_47150 [Streptosporangium oxazolinicum]|uniref:Uncharacterized protein n=1 Tax=Streptosporangium oxazolinicum TaxID=909287 RepID=A0ABP8B4M1_9ACTN
MAGWSPVGRMPGAGVALTAEGPPPVEGTGGGSVRVDGPGRGAGRLTMVADGSVRVAVGRGARAVRGAVVHDHLLSDWASCCHVTPRPAVLYKIWVISSGC